MIHIQSRLKAAGVHLIVSSVLAMTVASLVLLVWYPESYSKLCGGISLLYIVTSVDLILGPILTFVVFNRLKEKKELIRDVSIICVLQTIGFIYGLHTVYIARPVALVYEGARFRVVTAISVPKEELSKAEPEFAVLSLNGPKLLGIREFKNQEEKFDAANKALAGMDVGVRPIFWQDYSLSKSQVLKTARPVSELYKKYPDSKDLIDASISKTGLDKDKLAFLPVIARLSDWSLLLDTRTGQPVGFIEKDGFF
ncbi:TfpX/TfpZ family type IV pilin accessory protein [Undibacterium sp. RuTC16W]|uniref:TfpX/TfpZ family type IV pilin accessory protein n=1 Tax=Undibacterium sp. RuTC16W TaxID=3413048 RepID=UPI003BF119CE